MGLRDPRALPSLLTCCTVMLVGLSLCICKMEKQTPTAVETGVETGLCAPDGLLGAGAGVGGQALRAAAACSLLLV